MTKRLLIRIALVLSLTPFLMAASCRERTTTHNLAIFTAQADSALIAVTQGVSRLVDGGRMTAQVANTIYIINLKSTNAIDILRNRARTGFDKKEALTIIDNLIADARKAEADGVIGLTGEIKDRFLQITFFAQFTLRSIKAIIEAAKPPQDASTAQAAARSIAATRAQADGNVWTDLVLILQTAIFKGIDLERMNVEQAFAEGVSLHNALVTLLRSRGVGVVN